MTILAIIVVLLISTLIYVTITLSMWHKHRQKLILCNKNYIEISFKKFKSMYIDGREFWDYEYDYQNNVLKMWQWTDAYGYAEFSMSLYEINDTQTNVYFLFDYWSFIRYCMWYNVVKWEESRA